ncbi:MAG TPA: hypothetical protein VGQ91_04840 [Ideonella sp.]|jgi:hypothetical protein|nr:hypothetical protein [Ideonella sp.]
MINIAISGTQPAGMGSPGGAFGADPLGQSDPLGQADAVGRPGETGNDSQAGLRQLANLLIGILLMLINKGNHDEEGNQDGGVGDHLDNARPGGSGKPRTRSKGSNGLADELYRMSNDPLGLGMQTYNGANGPANQPNQANQSAQPNVFISISGGR